MHGWNALFQFISVVIATMQKWHCTPCFIQPPNDIHSTHEVNPNEQVHGSDYNHGLYSSFIKETLPRFDNRFEPKQAFRSLDHYFTYQRAKTEIVCVTGRLFLPPVLLSGWHLLQFHSIEKKLFIHIYSYI